MHTTSSIQLRLFVLAIPGIAILAGQTCFQGGIADIKVFQALDILFMYRTASLRTTGQSQSVEMLMLELSKVACVPMLRTSYRAESSSQTDYIITIVWLSCHVGRQHCYCLRSLQPDASCGAGSCRPDHQVRPIHITSPKFFAASLPCLETRILLNDRTHDDTCPATTDIVSHRRDTIYPASSS